VRLNHRASVEPSVATEAEALLGTRVLRRWAPGAGVPAADTGLIRPLASAVLHYRSSSRRNDRAPAGLAGAPERMRAPGGTRRGAPS
jgi:hypothetical protein